MHPAIYVLAPVILAIITNAIIYANNWQSNDTDTTRPRNPLLPPGYAIGAIWTAIFALLGYALYLARDNQPPSLASCSIVAIILWSLAYPFLTNGLKQKRGRILNTATLILAMILAIIVINQKPMAFPLIVPLLIWASYVNIADAIACSSASAQSKDIK